MNLHFFMLLSDPDLILAEIYKTIFPISFWRFTVIRKFDNILFNDGIWEGRPLSEHQNAGVEYKMAYAHAYIN